MKKVALILLALILTLSMCPFAVAEEEVNIHIMHWAGLPFEEALFQQWARTYEEEVEEGVARLVSIIEPTLVAFLCVVIGMILLSVMLPMAGIISSMI